MEPGVDIEPGLDIDLDRKILPESETASGYPESQIDPSDKRSNPISKPSSVFFV